MSGMTDDLGPTGAEKFGEIQQYLLPNEDILLACHIQKGFLIISNRRLVHLKEEGKSQYCIVNTVPINFISGIEQKKPDRFEVSGVVLDQYGQHTKETRSFEVKAPRSEKGESKDTAQNRFQSTMNRCLDLIEGRNSDTSTGDLSYLSQIPVSLTRNAILDLNTILRDQPIPDELVFEAEKLLGSEPFIIEESLRAGDDRENGVLFAAGKQGYYWIQGKKQGRFMSNVIVDTVEWDNVRCIAHQWHYDPPLINVTFSLVQGGKKTTKAYQWFPLVNDDTRQFPWLLQSSNGPYIFEDIVYKYSGKHIP